MSCTVLAPAVTTPAPDTPGDAFANDSRTAARVLARLRQGLLAEPPGTPAIDAVFEDLEAVLGETAAPTAADIAELAPRLHAVYRRIVHASRAPSSGVSQVTVAASRGLITEPMPRDFLCALGYVRRLAMAVSDLLEELLEDLP